MKKIAIVFSLFLFTASAVKAQDLKKAKGAYALASAAGAKPEMVEAAKTEVDKLSTDAKLSGQAESHLLKAQVYGLLAKDTVLSAKYPSADAEAYTALKKYLELEPAETNIKLAGYRGVNEVYNSFFTKGVKYYNAQDWENAFTNFKNMAEMGDMLIARKWSNTGFDTTAYLYAAASAQNAKKEADAVKYYAGLANLKIGGKDYPGVYEFLTKYYLNNPNETEFKKYIGYAKELYPDNTLWKDLEFEYNKRNSDIGDILTKFDAADAAKTLTATEYFDYGNYFVSDKKIKELDEAKRNEFNRKAIYAFIKAYQMDTTNAIAAYNAGVTTYANFEAASDSARAIKGATADIKAKRIAAQKIASDAADQSIEWFDKAFTRLSEKTERSNLEKGLLNKSIDLMYNIYEYKRDMSRGVNPKDYDKYEAKLTYLNTMHDKYK